MGISVALIFPPSTFLSAPFTWPPLGLWYLAVQLEAHRIEQFCRSYKDADYVLVADGGSEIAFFIGMVLFLLLTYG